MENTEVVGAPKVGILTAFQSLDRQYSLVNVVTEQIRMFHEAGMPVEVHVLDTFDDSTLSGPWLSVDVLKTLPTLRLRDYSDPEAEVSKEFWAQVEAVEVALEQGCAHLDVIIQHDLLFQGWFLPYNLGLRRFAERHPQIRWLHWMHSAPDPQNRTDEEPRAFLYRGMPNSKFIYLNYGDVRRVALKYGIPVESVAVVFNTVDLFDFRCFHPITRKIVERYDLLNPMVVMIYPTRMSPGKQPDHAVRLAGAFKWLGEEVRLIFCNSYSNAKAEKELIESLKKISQELGLTGDEVIFTSEFRPDITAEEREWANEVLRTAKTASWVKETAEYEAALYFTQPERFELGVPRRVVGDLFSLSNVFALPSLSEAGPLILAEAAMNKVLLVLNRDFPPLMDYVGGNNAAWVRWSSTLMQTTYHPDIDTYHRDVANGILMRIEENPVLTSWKRFMRRNRKWVWEHQLKPLILSS